MSNDVGTSRTVACSGCGAKVAVPSSVVQVRCAACGSVFTPTAPIRVPASQTRSATAPARSNQVILLACVVFGGLLLISLVGASTLIFATEEPATKADPVDSASREESEENEPTVFPDPSEVVFREIRLPEDTRRAIYKDYRSAARTTIEKPLPLPSGSPPRAALETMLQQTLDRELSRFAALHNVSIEDIGEVINEGDAKRWDPSPRSNATRNGIRLYPKSMSEGWKKSENIR